MNSKTLKIKSRTIKNDFELIYVTDNNSFVEFEVPINILNVSFGIEIITNIDSDFFLKIQMSSELNPKNIFITKINFHKNNKKHYLNIREIIEKSENFQQFSNIDIQFISLETNSDIDIDLTLNF